MDASPRTAREALVAEILGDVDRLMQRQQANTEAQRESEENLKASITALVDAGERYRQAVDEYSNQAKKDLASYLKEIAAKTAAKTMDEQRVEIQETVQAALKENSKGVRQQIPGESRVERLTEHAITAFIASGATAGLVYAVFNAC